MYKASATLVTNPYKDRTKKENYKPTSLMNIDAKFPQMILGNQIQQHIKRSRAMIKLVLFSGIQENFNISKSVSIIELWDWGLEVT